MLTGFNDLYTVNPKLCKERDCEKNDIEPKNITAHSSKKLWWKCTKGHGYEARISNRNDLNRNCPYCKNKGIDL